MSEPYALLIVGGGPAGLAAARAFRGASGVGKVAIVADEHRVPYERPPLTKELLRGESSEEALAIEPESWLAHQRVDLVAGRVVALDPGRRGLLRERCRRLLRPAPFEIDATAWAVTCRT